MIKRTLKYALMMSIVLGVQALSLDMTCMTLWHNSPVDFYGITDHHPDSPESHQDADDGHNFVGDIEASLVSEERLPSGELATTFEDGSTFLDIYSLRILLKFPFLDDGDPPKPAALV